MPEISDEDFKTLNAAKNLMDSLLRSPKTKRVTERAIKELHPDTVISEDFEAPLANEIKGIGEKLDKFLNSQAEREQDGKLNAAFDELRGPHWSFTDEGIEKVKKIMVERKIADPLAAAAYYERNNPKPEPQKPTSFHGLGWGIGAKTDDADTKLLFEDEDAWMEKQAMAHFNETTKG